MAQSLKLRSFTTLGNLNTQVLDDDFSSKDFATLKLKGSTSGGAKFENKAKLSLSYDEQWKHEVKDEGKLQFPLFDNRITVELCQRNKEVKGHVDLGQVKISGKDLNLFTNLKTNKQFNDFQWRLGTNYFGKNCESSTRLEIISNEPLQATHRTFVRRNQMIFAGVLSLNLASFQLTRYDGVIGYENDKNDVYLKHVSDSKQKQNSELQLGEISFHLQHKLNNKTKLGLLFKRKGDALNASVGFQHQKCDKLLLKGKVSLDQNVELAAKYQWGQVGITAAASLQQFGKKFNLSNFPPLPFGLTFDLKV